MKTLPLSSAGMAVLWGMLSYQHSYHAGNRADMHKHDLLCRVLEKLCAKDRPLTYIETHAGRGLYDLTSAEALKTGEAGEGWLEFVKDLEKLKTLSKSYTGCVSKLNDGKLAPLYPGSPLLAAHILRPYDKMHLMELHPAEHEALVKNMGQDQRVHIYKEDGLKKALALAPPRPPHGLLMVDPSYERKFEYETVADFVLKIHKKWMQAAILVWIPMLPAGQHGEMIAHMRAGNRDLSVSEVAWAKPEDGRGMYGSIMAGINLPKGIKVLG
ncbi:MAG: 23S rRNA (adenine(2030)-N(6))-methyltransferase RlmJ [Alphaproteobacteria bacterium]|nr:23S rRNA (adenine(2030)-N(6))-methyltransferase RlmJ [Alphaproteobacteria bacterium]